MPFTQLETPNLSVFDVAEMFNVPFLTVRKWARERRLASTQIGREYRFSESDVRDLMARARIKYTKPPAAAV